jgi:hypothetical protein
VECSYQKLEKLIIVDYLVQNKIQLTKVITDL